MNALVVILVAALPFALVAFVLYRVLFVRVMGKTLRPAFAVLLYWIAIAVVPWVLLWVQVPLANYIFGSIPSLQTAAWDVGLAINLSLGMILSYLTGVVAAVLATRQFLHGATHGV
ncbi:MAG: hypothetical protein H6R16_1010 [Proteobacteria bacterium]|nr:hypothetical protein [Pseudomonadota bacterium]